MHHAKGRLCRMRVGAPAALAYKRAPPPNTRAAYRLAILPHAVNLGSLYPEKKSASVGREWSPCTPDADQETYKALLDTSPVNYWEDPPEKKVPAWSSPLEGPLRRPPFERRACASCRPQGGAAGGDARARPRRIAHALAATGTVLARPGPSTDGPAWRCARTWSRRRV